ncbi:MAG: metallophosphoesterase [Lachnospiraceae bacterium]|nr:metallophosphoesterase [Lachnospiraceae bacterium]
MFYITGDTHRDFTRFSKRSRFRSKCHPGEGDYVIVCGDFGLLWDKTPTFAFDLDVMSRYPFTILWVQGNHENYDMIAEYPIEYWNGGKVRHIIRDKVILLERGQVFQIDGKSFFTFGGASCHDIQDGILDPNDPDFTEKRRKADRQRKMYRIRNVSWWEAELPTEEEMREGMQNLEKAGNQVDFVITHCPSGWGTRAVFRSMGLPFTEAFGYKEDVLTKYFDQLEEKVVFTHWFFGHLHDDLTLDEQHTMLYHGIVRLTADENIYEIV